MYKAILFLFGLLLAAASTEAQSEASFTVECSSDSVLMDNYLIVRFVLENGSGAEFTAPKFEDFEASGPNISSSMSVMNGEVSQRIVYTFQLRPRDIGNLFIEPAGIVVDGEVLETEPLEIIALPNPDGIIENPEPMVNDPFRMEFDWPDFQFPFPELQPEEPVKKKKKRKTYKL